MRLTLKNTAFAALAAATLITSAASPALAGKSERAFLAGVLATAVVGGLVLNANQSRANTAEAPVYDDGYRRPASRDHDDRFRRDDRFDYDRRLQTQHELERYSSRNRAEPARYSPQASRLQPTERAFHELSFHERRRVQQRLARAGYYGYGIDGQWGPATERAVTRFARDNRASAALGSTEGARRLYSAILTY
jgi:hypothetical protein